MKDALLRLAGRTPLVAAVLIVTAAAASTARADASLDWFVPVTHDTTVAAGEMITWTWTDDLPHSVTSLSGPDSFDSGVLTGNGTTFSFTAATAGAYTYQCDVHPQGMTGTITVQAAAANGGDGPTSPPAGSGLAPETGSSLLVPALTAAGAAAMLAASFTLGLTFVLRSRHSRADG